MANIKLSTLLAGSNIAFLGRSEFTATAGQTTFNVTYTPPYVVVEQNGLTLAPSDYNATDGSQVILNVSSSEGDSIVITSYQPTSIADAVSTARSINTNNTLNGGGTLASDLTFSVNTAAIVANTYLQTILGDYTSNSFVTSTFTSNSYASNTFSSYDAIVITTPAANTEYEFLRALPRNQDYREIYYSTQFGSANVGFWVGSNLVANVNVSSTANTNNINVTGKKGDRVYIHLYDAAISSTANLEFSFGG